MTDRTQPLIAPRASEPPPGTNRREFLRWSAAAVGAGAVGTGIVFSRTAHAGADNPSLPSRAHRVVRDHVQHFRSRPDLRPPQIIVDIHHPSVQPGCIVTECHGGSTQQGPLILDEAGRLVWFSPVSSGPTNASRAFNVHVQSYRGQPVIAWFEGAAVSAHGRGHYEIHDQHYQRVAAVHAGNGYHGDLHEFLLTDQGTALFTCYGRATARLPNGRRGHYFYGVVQEVDVATGAVLFQWRSDEHVPLAASYEGLPADPADTWDYFHINSICVDPADGNLIISSRNTWACYKVHRRTGKVIWKLGGKRSDFAIGPGAAFAFQHDVKLRPGGVLTIFDNEAGPPAEARSSRGLILAIDEPARRVRLVRQFRHHPELLAVALGSVQPITADHTFIGWGPSSYFTEYGRRGRVRFDGRLAGGVSSYRAFKQPWAATPRTPPAVAVDRREHGGASVFASWNGATEVARWAVLGGSAPHELAPLGTALKRDFETEIRLDLAPAWVAVQALSPTGALLATSRPRRV